MKWPNQKSAEENLVIQRRNDSDTPDEVSAEEMENIVMSND